MKLHFDSITKIIYAKIFGHFAWFNAKGELKEDKIYGGLINHIASSV